MVNLKYFKIFEKDIYLKESTEIKNVLDNSFSIKNYKSKSCDVKYTEAGAKTYWNINAPDESTKKLQIDQKINSIKEKIDPIFKRTKEYYIKYTGSPYFTEKIREKSKKQGREWGPANKASLDKFINRIYYLTCPPNDSSGVPDGVVGWVSPIVWDQKTLKDVPAYNLININLNLLTNKFSEKQMSDTLVHEMRHCIDFYFTNQGLDIVPGVDDYSALLALVRTANNRKLTPQENEFLSNYIGGKRKYRKEKYISDELENSARYQGLKYHMGVDDFGTFENFISLLKKNLTADYKTWDKKNLIWKKVKDMELEFTKDEKLKFLKDPSNRAFFYYDRKETESSPLGDLGDFDFGHLIINFNEKNKNENEIVINLKKLYNHSFEFAKNDSNKEENGEQRA
jgi:hypothetical protein